MAIEKVTYCLNSTVDAFVHWISQRTQSDPCELPAKYAEGHYVLQPVQLPSQKIDQRQISLQMTGSYVPRSAGAKTPPQGSCAIRFKIEPLLPRKRQIEVTVECNEYLVKDYFERLLIAIGWAFPAVLGGSEAKTVRATIEKIAAITDKMGYKSSLELKMKVALGELDSCLREFHSMLSGEEWLWETVPTLGETRSTRLEMHTDGVSCLGSQIWYVKALDVPSDDELGTPFCIISASPPPGGSHNQGNVLNVDCWPDWNKGDTPLSYREYLTALLGESRQRGMIKHLPKWLTEPEHMGPAMPAREGAGKRCGGRPRKADDDWAYQETKSGRDQTEVYKEWLERIPKNRRSQLADPLDSFKKAISYREKKEKRE